MHITISRFSIHLFSKKEKFKLIMEELDKVKIKSLKINFTLKTNKLQEELKLSLILSVRERENNGTLI